MKAKQRWHWQGCPPAADPHRVSLGRLTRPAYDLTFVEITMHNQAPPAPNTGADRREPVPMHRPINPCRGSGRRHTALGRAFLGALVVGTIACAPGMAQPITQPTAADAAEPATDAPVSRGPDQRPPTGATIAPAGTPTAARLEQRIQVLERRQLELEAEAAKVPTLERELGASKTLADRAAEEAAALRTEIDQLRQQRQSQTEKHTAQLNAAELRLREHKDRVGGVETRIQQLEQLLAQREAQIERLKAAEAQRATHRAQLEARLAEIRAQLPAPEGGTLTAKDARHRAETDAEVLERLLDEGRGIQNPRLWQQIREAENALHRSQFLLARAEGARTVYRVRPGDSLAMISLLFYGDDAQWDRVFEANRHLLGAPDDVWPGLTLVIP